MFLHASHALVCVACMFLSLHESAMESEPQFKSLGNYTPIKQYYIFYRNFIYITLQPLSISAWYYYRVVTIFLFRSSFNDRKRCCVFVLLFCCLLAQSGQTKTAAISTMRLRQLMTGVIMISW